MKTIKKLLVVAMLLPLLSACSWLDVDSDTYILEEDLFSTEDGYFSALNGIYLLLSDDVLYAQNLTKGIPTILSGFYSSLTFSKNTGYYEISSGELDAANTETLTGNVWSAAYTAIANCNNLINYTEEAATDMFSSCAREMILGEALAIRAFLHFEMLTLFAPAIGEDGADDKRIPYVDDYPIHQPEYKTAQEVLDLVIADFVEAREYLKELDVELNPSNMTSANLFNNFMISSDQLAYSIRGTHLNYFATSVLLCRAYMYNGDYASAKAIAQELYEYGPDGSGTQLFSFTDVTAFELKHEEDVLFATYNTNMMDSYVNTYLAYSHTLNSTNIPALFSGQTDYDIRYSKLISVVEPTYSWEDPYYFSKRWRLGTEDEDTSGFDYSLSPIVRFSEVYHMLAECYARENLLDDAMTILNQMRQNRGKFYTGTDEFGAVISRPYMPLVGATTMEEAISEITKEYARESLDEGRAFWMYKRTGYDTGKESTLNVPQVETDYMTL
ncbi:MAG: RagB/SusD family nutrient uptake outer membrane protein [Rikenellaceae bacterium]